MTSAETVALPRLVIAGVSSGVVTTDGRRHSMVGLLSSEARMRDKLQAFGYVEVETQRPTILGDAGRRFRGHQFRYVAAAVVGACEHFRRGRGT